MGRRPGKSPWAGKRGGYTESGLCSSGRHRPEPHGKPVPAGSPVPGGPGRLFGGRAGRRGALSGVRFPEPSRAGLPGRGGHGKGRAGRAAPAGEPDPAGRECRGRKAPGVGSPVGAGESGICPAGNAGRGLRPPGRAGPAAAEPRQRAGRGASDRRQAGRCPETAGRFAAGAGSCQKAGGRGIGPSKEPLRPAGRTAGPAKGAFVPVAGGAAPDGLPAPGMGAGAGPFPDFFGKGGRPGKGLGFPAKPGSRGQSVPGRGPSPLGTG